MRKVTYIGYLLLTIVILGGCRLFPSSSIPPARIPITTLLVTASRYPSGWNDEHISNNTELVGGDVENISKSFRYKNAFDVVSVHTVLRYRSPKNAEEGYTALTTYFQSSGYGSSPRVASSMVFQSVKHTVICSGDQICIFFAQYKEYVTFLSARIGMNAMKSKEFEALITSVDDTMNKSMTK